MRRLRIACAIGTAALATACATPWEVDDVQTVIGDPPPAVTGPAFTRALFEGYRVEARNEALEEYNWVHAAVFARKGLRAATGEVVPPENPTEWELPAERQAELGTAHTRLLRALASGAPERQPEIAAEAQTSFDCWLGEETKYNQGENLAKCRSTFVRAITKLDPAPAAAAAQPQAAAPAVVRSFEVYFDFNRTGLTPQARKQLTEIVAAHADLKPSEVRVIGHTDTVGRPAYNQRLSSERARAVASSLAHFGIVTVQTGVGKTDLAVPTGEGVAELRNRRVEILFIK